MYILHKFPNLLLFSDGIQVFESLPVPSNVTDSFEWNMHMVDHPFQVYIAVENELGRVVSNLINIQTLEQGMMTSLHST